jgi:excisionase family DNA binding protein
MNEEKVFLSVTEAAEFLVVSKATIYDWVHRRRIPYRKHGSRVVFSKGELARWSADQAVPTLFHAAEPSVTTGGAL